MRIYQIHKLNPDNKSLGYSYYANKKDAKRVAKELGRPYGEINDIDVDISKLGIINALNIYGGHPYNRTP